jgi:hypothetical protein
MNQGGVDHGAPTAGPNDYARYSPGRVTSTGTGSFNGAAQGGTSTPHNNMQPTAFVNVMIKL